MQYIATVKHSLQRRWERVSEQLVTDVQLENVWVGLRTANRTRERPDQTPGPADKGARTPGENKILFLFLKLNWKFFIQVEVIQNMLQ